MTHIRHLYLKIYVAFIVILLGSLLAAVVVRVSVERDFEKYPQFAHGVAELLVERVPTQPGAAMNAALDHAADKLGIDLVLWSSDGALLGKSAGVPVEVTQHEPGFQRGSHSLVVPLPDGRQVAAFFRHAPAHGKFFLWLAFFAGVLAVGCYPLARGITRRLELLRKAADAWGQGSLTTRAPVQGYDEIAELSRTFNLAAERVESLVAQQKRVLASASHELRSPLARMQLALALLEDASEARRAELVAGLEREVMELDQVVDDFLTVAKAGHSGNQTTVALGTVLTRECERARVSDVQVEEINVRGSAAGLRSLVRNLLENAQRHGGASEICVSLQTVAERAVIRVEDRGPGIAAAEAERVFEPFYRPQGHDEGKHGGVGLGLALVRQIAEAHGGSAHYEPRSGGGSRFVVHIPIGA
jgi:two-component system, OmpR family, sensor kinase